MTGSYGSIETTTKDDELGLEESSRGFIRYNPFTRKVAVSAIVVLAIFFVAHHNRFLSEQVNSDSAPKHERSDPSRAFYYHDQLVDHGDPEGSGNYSQRYYESLDYFSGPSSPIFAILGGEDELERILYPFISEVLGQRFGAYTICMEHRFYGKSQPVPNPTNADLRQLLSPKQAMQDFLQLIRHKQETLGCGPRGTPTYCPVMTIGGSYPGFLSALMRLVHSEVVDIGYASSAPLHLYSHDMDHGAYFEKITQVAESASPGCANAVRTALIEGQDHILSSSKDSNVKKLASEFGVCADTIPEYIDTVEILSQEIMMVVANHFAENNMGYYPPHPDQELIQGCHIFQQKDLTSVQKIAFFLAMRTGKDDACFDVTVELPPGPRGTISASDWSGVGGGNSGYMWDYQSCHLIPEYVRSGIAVSCVSCS